MFFDKTISDIEKCLLNYESHDSLQSSLRVRAMFTIKLDALKENHTIFYDRVGGIVSKFSINRS
jgi:hypothetical protein